MNTKGVQLIPKSAASGPVDKPLQFSVGVETCPVVRPVDQQEIMRSLRMGLVLGFRCRVTVLEQDLASKQIA
eukprot:764148-Hanusia_phi.AAC.4